MRQAMGFCALALLLASTAFAGDGRKSLLTPPEGVVSDARGTVEIEDDALEIKVVNLMPDAAYSVWLDDGSAVLAEIGSLMTDEAGKGKIEFKSDADPEDAREAPLPFGVENADQLAGRAMEIRDSEAAVVLEGMTPDLQFTEDEGLSGRFLVQQPDPPIDEDARGWILLVEEDLHQMIKVLLHKLAPETVYSISLSSPGGDAELLGMVTTNPGGVGQLRVDNLKLDAIPFGVSSLTELEGYGVAVADPEENVVLTGIIGALTPGDGDDDDGDDDDGDDEDDDDDCDEPEIESESCLEAADPDSRAHGEISVSAECEKEKMKIKVIHLAAASVYAVSITSADGGTTEALGEITTTGRTPPGKGELVLRSGDPLPLGAASIRDLAGAAVSIADGEGAEVLSGVVPSLDDPTVCEDDDDDDDEDEVDEPKIKVKAKITRGGSVLSVDVEHLDPETIYEVVITNTATSESESLGMITTDAEGEAELELETGEGDLLPLGATTVEDLVGFEISVKTEGGDVVLTAVVPSPSVVPPSDSGGGADLPIGIFAVVGEFDMAFLRGDANSDRRVDISDPIFTLSHLFIGGPRPVCLDAADSNDDGDVDISDAVTSLKSLFGSHGRLPEPGDFVEGFDPTADGLFCEE